MTERRLYPEGTVPECATPEWYAGREHAPHLEQSLHRPRLHVAAGMVRALLESNGYTTVVDLGAGDGGLLSLLADTGARLHGYDLQPSNVAAAAERGVDVELGDVVDELHNMHIAGVMQFAEVAICTEVLEHLVDPHAFLAALAACTEVRALVASSPWTETTGDAYEFHLWAWDQAGYVELLTGAGWHVVEQQVAGMFQVVAAVRDEARP